MKVEDFLNLCEAQWAADRGKVKEVHLREASFDELYEDVFLNRDKAVQVTIVHPNWDIVNPVTRELVSVNTTKLNYDYAIVHYGAKQDKSVRL